MFYRAKLRLYSNKALFAVFVFSALAFYGCKPGKKKVDVSQVELSLSAQRFEEDIALHYDDVAFLRNKYGSFFELFIKRIVPLPGNDSVALKEMIKNFINDADIQNIYADSRKLYTDFSKENQQLTDAFRHYKYYFPGKVIPQAVTMISGFNYGIVAIDSVLAIGLDMYLGDSSRYYPGLHFPAYKIRRMRREYIAADAMRGWIQSDWEQDAAHTDLLSSLIYQGKILYAVDMMLPDAADSIKTGYTASQLKWCEENEKNTWGFFVDNKLLYASEPGQLGRRQTASPKNLPAISGSGWAGESSNRI
jgi:hypothetical protein